MSDMLQLVVEIRNPQAMILLVTSATRVPNIDDKLKSLLQNSGLLTLKALANSSPGVALWQPWETARYIFNTQL